MTFFLEKQKGFTIFAASLKLTIMRKVITSFVLALFVTVANAQYYGVGSSTSSTDSWGNTTTVHKDAYGNRTGTSTSHTDSWGTTTTTHRDSYGNTIGTSTSSTDSWGNTTTTHKDAYGNRTGSSTLSLIHI